MLALVRSTGVKGISRNARALSTVASSASLPDAGAEQPDDMPLDKVGRRRRQLASSSAECMFVYPWNGIRSSAEGLAIARAVQEKYGPAREVIFPRDTDYVTVFQPHFWLVFDNADVRKRLPEESAEIRVYVQDLPKGDGNVGVEEMVRALGLSTGKGEPPKPPPSAEGEESADVADAAEGYKTVDVRVEWARFGPSEVLQRRRPQAKSLPERELIPKFAASWLAFDGFSPEAARGAHTPESVSELGAEPSEAVDDAPIAASREWVPIVPLSPSLTPTTVSQSDVDIHTTDDLAPIATAATAAATATAAAPDPVIRQIPAGSKMSRRERILHLARQNAQTPLPEFAEKPQPVVEAEKYEGVSDQEGKERTIRERLWRLVGGNY
ncbi:hypothetical protein EDB87DRAFT_1677930 [Lactarius vividus]|nr:hypothetical protein EDB87DRAFT_1677930 [Lactarius vividus]